MAKGAKARFTLALHKLAEYSSCACGLARSGVLGSILRRQIEATDKQIDRLVYELYGLTEEEIRIVEASS